ncbi:MAG: tandem-95 repeat protein [Chloroflexota bacterium]
MERSPVPCGTDSFTYRASDGTATSNLATVTLTVNCVNDAPVAADDGYSTAEDTTLSIAAPGVLSNDSDVENSSLSAALVSSAAHGNLSFNADGSFSYSPAMNFNGTDTFTYKANDGTTDSGVATVTITVSGVNDLPVVNAGPDQAASEGALVDVHGTFSDVDASDTHTFSWSVNATSGQAVAAGATEDFSFTPIDNGTYTLTFTVTDDKGGVSSDTLLVSVANAAPVYTALQVDAPANQGALEGVAQSFDIGSFVDAGLNDAAWAVDVDWGDSGTISFNAASQGDLVDKSHLFANDGLYTVSVTVTDKDGASDSDTFSISVGNVAPAVSAGADASITEGDTFSGSGSFTDSGADSWSATVNYGDGSGVAALALSGKTFSLSHTYADNGSYTVTVSVNDDDTSGSDTLLVSVANAAPTATFNASTPVTEGSPISLSLSDRADVSPVDQAAGFTYAFGCGTAAGYSPFTTSNTTSCPTNDNGTRTVRGTIKDKDGGTTEYTRNVTISNTPPVIQTAILSLNSVSGVVTSSVQWTDAGSADTETVTFTYRNGVTVIATESYTGKPANGFQGDTKDFGPGCYNLSVTIDVTDDDGGTDQELRSQTSADVYAATFDAPIMQNERNIVKYGNAVPVKVRLASSCTGALTNAPTLYITVAPGITIDTYGSEVIVESVSNADTGQQMRPIDSKYMYNLSTKGLKANTNYEIRIRAGAIDGPIITQAHLYPKR